MPEHENAEVVAELWRRIQARDWDAAGELLAEDVVCEWPHSLERIRGRDNYIALNRTYPEGWTIDVRRIVSAGAVVVSEVRVPHEELGTHWAASFFEIRDGKIARETDYWVIEGAEQPPPGRARWIERM